MKSKGILKHAYENTTYLFCSCDCDKKSSCRRHISNYEFTEQIKTIRGTAEENCQYLDFDIEYEIIEEINI